MKVSTQLPFCLLTSMLVSIISATPIPSNEANETTTIVEGASAPHTSDGAAVVNIESVETQPHVESFVKAAGYKCITFTSDNPNWVYRNDIPWTGAGTFGHGKKTICVPRSNSAGGAMFIAPTWDTLPGSTKLECFFPTAGVANCDASLVDGYSLSVTCHVKNQRTPTIGGEVNLWKRGQSCPNQSQLGKGICKNDQGYASSETGVSNFFREATRHGNHYCIFVNCSQDYFFDTNEPMSCHISGGR